jgi:hypothetical protein
MFYTLMFVLGCNYGLVVNFNVPPRIKEMLACQLEVLKSTKRYKYRFKKNNFYNHQMSKVAALRALFSKDDIEQDDRPSRPSAPKLETTYRPRLKPRHESTTQNSFQDITILTNDNCDESLFSRLQSVMFTEPDPTIKCENEKCTKEAIWECELCECFLCDTCEYKHQLTKHKQSHRKGINWITVSRYQSADNRRVICSSKSNHLYGFWSVPYDSRTIADIKQWLSLKISGGSAGEMFYGAHRIKDDKSLIYSFQSQDENSLLFTFTIKLTYR